MKDLHLINSDVINLSQARIEISSEDVIIKITGSVRLAGENPSVRLLYYMANCWDRERYMCVVKI